MKNLFEKLNISLLLFWSVLLTTACHHEQTAPDLIPVDQMVEILKEFHLAEGSVGQIRLSNEQRTELRDLAYDKLLEKYSMERETFYSSYEYYLTRPILMDTIYARIIDQLNHQLPEEQSRRGK